jgi:phospholipase/carboxylesterase
MNRLGPLRVRRARLGGQTPRNDGDKPPIACVLLHGYGAPGDDLVPLAEAIGLPGAELFFPEAPLSAGVGRAWWPIDIAALERAMMLGIERDRSEEMPPGLPSAREAMMETLEAIAHELPEHAIVLGGFSQGAMLALDVALHDPRALAGLVLLSGTLIAQEQWRPRLPSRRGLAVFQSHGKDDPILSYPIALRLSELLTAAGLSVAFHPFPGGHGIPPTVLRSLEAWLRQRPPQR